MSDLTKVKWVDVEGRYTPLPHEQMLTLLADGVCVITGRIVGATNTITVRFEEPGFETGYGFVGVTPKLHEEVTFHTQSGVKVMMGGNDQCPVCIYGEPTNHTCDEGQQHRYHIEITGRAGRK